MHLIKKYPNRKFYDMEGKRYVALEDISSLVRAGEEIQVVDSKSGQDITTLVLSQILREQERKGSFLPQALLTALVKRGSGGLKQVRNSFEASWKALQVLEDDVQEKLDALVERGEISLTEAQELREELLARARHNQRAMQESILKEIEASLVRLDAPSKSDLEGLNRQLEKLETRVDLLLSDAGPDKS